MKKSIDDAITKALHQLAFDNHKSVTTVLIEYYTLQKDYRIYERDYVGRENQLKVLLYGIVRDRYKDSCFKSFYKIFR